MGKAAGILGGLGPMATVYFYEMVVRMTNAKKDQEHIDMVIMNKATTPDRTEYINGESDKNPAIDLINSAKKIQACGCSVIAMPCNTAHYFYDEIQANIDVKMLNMPKETVKYIKNKNYKKVGILATKGTIKANIYQNICKQYNLEYEILDQTNQDIIMDIIYNQIKAGQKPNMKDFYKTVEYLKAHNCDCIILGCTELSILKEDNNLDQEFYIDSMEKLAEKLIEYSGKTPKGE